MAYTINPSHGDIAIVDPQYNNNLHYYHLFKNMNSDMRDIIVSSINNLRLKGSKYLVVGYTNKTSVEIMYWLYIFYGKITPNELMKNQYTM